MQNNYLNYIYEQEQLRSDIKKHLPGNVKLREIDIREQWFLGQREPEIFISGRLTYGTKIESFGFFLKHNDDIIKRSVQELNKVFKNFKTTEGLYFID